MSKKLTIEEVNEYFESQGCILLTKDYKNVKQKLKYICDCGNESEIAFNKFKMGRRCNICAKEKRANSRRRFHYKDVLNDFSDNGAILLTKEEDYHSVNQTLEYICSCGSYHKINYSRYKNGVRCPVCCGNNIKPFSDVVEILNKSGYELISKECDYSNGKSILEMKCPNGHFVYKGISKFVQNNNSNVGNCFECRNEKIGDSRRFDYEYVKEYFYENGCELLEGEYRESTIQKLRYRCVCDNVSEISFTHFKNNGARCQECRKEKMSLVLSGENHYNYNLFLTDEEREAKRATKEYREWRVRVYEKDNFTCACCSKKSERLNAHHRNSWNAYPEQRYDVENGVTLCEKCHTEFHHIYGYGFNTEGQFEEYINNKKANSA